MKRRSGVRIKTPFEIALDLEVLVLSSNAAQGRLVSGVAPSALLVTCLGDDPVLWARLRTHPVVCAVLIDGALPRSDQARLCEQLQSRWARVPAHQIVPVGGVRPGRADALSFSMETEPEWRRETVVREFLGGALDERLRWVAGLLTFAYERELAGAILETFVAFAIRQVRRDELARHLGVSEAAVEKRVRQLCEQIGCDKVTHLAQVLVTIPPLEAPRAIMAMLEERATALRAGGKENPTRKIQ